MPSPPTRSRRPGPSRHRRLALSLLVASALVSVPQAAALGQDLALGSGGEHLLSESLSSPARPVRPPPAPAAADVGPSIPAGVKPFSVAASPDIAALPSQASSSSGRRLSSTAVIGSGSVDAGDEPGTRRTTSHAKSSGSANDGWLAHPPGSRRQHDAFSAAQASGPEISSIFTPSAAEDSESEIAASRPAVPSIRGRRRSESSATGDSQTARQRQSLHRRLAKRQQEAELELTGPSEAAKTEGSAALSSTAADSPSTAAALPASTISALADSLSSVPAAATASPSATSISGTPDTVGGEPSSSTKAAGGARPVPTLSNSLPAPDPFPQPFDTTLSLNFTAPCLKFFGRFLTDPTFVACRPLSLLISSSAAFAKLTRAEDLDPLASVVQASLEPVGGADVCASAMEAFGGEMAKKCSADLKSGNALANQALTGFEAYALVHNASALADADGTNCFLDATGAAGADDSYYWGLWQGQTLPPSTKPTCSSCSKALLATYANSGLAANSSAALSNVYGRAVNLTNAACGPGWASLVVVQPAPSRAAASFPSLRFDWSSPASIGPWTIVLAMIAASMI